MDAMKHQNQQESVAPAAYHEPALLEETEQAAREAALPEHTTSMDPLAEASEEQGGPPDGHELETSDSQE